MVRFFRDKRGDSHKEARGFKPPSLSEVRKRYTVAELLNSIRDLKIQLETHASLPLSEQNPQHLYMLRLSIDWNTQALKLLSPRLTTEKIEELSSLPPPPPELKPEPFASYNLSLNDLRTSEQMERLKHHKVFKFTDVSSYFQKFMRESDLNLLLVTAPLYEKYQTSEFLIPSDNVSKKRVRIGGADIFPQNRSLTVVAKKIERVGEKVFIPLGITYSKNVEADQMHTLLPTRVEIYSNGKLIEPFDMTVLSNGLIYIDLDPSISISEIHIVYGKPQPQGEDSIIKFGETQTEHSGSLSPLEGDAPFSEAENTFRNTLMYNKPQRTTAVPNKYTGSKLTQIETLNRILTYLQNTFLRYSVLDTLNEPGVTDNARRALRGMRTSCLGAANVAKHIIDTNKFSPRFYTKSGILCGFSVGIPQNNAEVSLDRFHAVTFAKLGGQKERIYDITPNIEYREPFQEKFIQDFIKNSNKVYRYIKNMFLEIDSFRHYQTIFRKNERIFNSLVSESKYSDKFTSLTDTLFRDVLFRLEFRAFHESFNIVISEFTTDLSDYIGLKFPFSLVAAQYMQELDFENILYECALNNAENLQFLRECGLEFNEDMVFQDNIPVSNKAINALKLAITLENTVPESLMQSLIRYQESMNLYLERINDLKNNLNMNKTLITFLREYGLEINEEEFNKLDWFGFIAIVGYERDFFTETKGFSPDKLITYLSYYIASKEKDFREFLDTYPEEILRIFREKNSTYDTPPETSVSSTFLWRPIASSTPELSSSEKTFISYSNTLRLLRNFYNSQRMY